MRATKGYAAIKQGGELQPWSFERRDLHDDDIALKILFCGVCHTDVFTVNVGQEFPLVPGHEIVGEVTAVGANVSRFKPGEMVVMGTIVDSCRNCTPCRHQEETYCEEGVTGTFASPDPRGGGITQGGYSTEYVVDQWFAYPMPAGLDPAGVAPLLCAGVTTYSPLRHWNVNETSKVGVVGIGGLGHLAIKFAHALGAKVVAFTTSPEKVEGGLKLGADEVVLSKDSDAMSAQAKDFDFILSTISGAYDPSPYLGLLKHDGTLCTLGVSADPLSFNPMPLTAKRLTFSSSASGGTMVTDEMLAFCSRHGITADVEVIRMDQINEAFARLEKGDVHYRFVIDMKSFGGS